MVVTYPGATWRPLGPQTQPAIRTHEVVCLHTMVGYLTSTDAYFRAQGYAGTESHFGVGGRWGPDAASGLDGTVWQWQDLDHTADANLEGNDRVVSIETADNAPAAASDIEAWTPAQLDAIVSLVAWLCRKYDIPPQLVPDTRPGTRGIAYHAQGTAAVLPTGAERWSTTVGKPCPGARRIAQITTTVIPRVQATLRGEEVDVPLTDAEFLRIRQEVITALNDPTHQYLQDELAPLKAGLKVVMDGQAQLAQAVAALQTQVAQAPTLSGTIHVTGDLTATETR